MPSPITVTPIDGELEVCCGETCVRVKIKPSAEPSDDIWREVPNVIQWKMVVGGLEEATSAAERAVELAEKVRDLFDGECSFELQATLRSGSPRLQVAELACLSELMHKHGMNFVLVLAPEP